jgi:hypothetical protein
MIMIRVILGLQEASMREIGNIYTILFWKHLEKEYYLESGIDGRTILSWILNK